MNFDTFIQTIDELRQNRNIEENTQILTDISNSVDNITFLTTLIFSDTYQSIYRGYAALYMEKMVNLCFIPNTELANYATQFFNFLKELKNFDNFLYNNSFSLFAAIIRKGFIEDQNFDEAISEFFNPETIDDLFIAKLLICIGNYFSENEPIQNHDNAVEKIMHFVPFDFIKDSLNAFIKDPVANDAFLKALDLLLAILKMLKVYVDQHSSENLIQSLHLNVCSIPKKLIDNANEIPQWVELLNTILLSSPDDYISNQTLDCILHFISFHNEKDYYPQIKNTIINLITRDDERNSSREYLKRLVFILYKYIHTSQTIENCITGDFLSAVFDFTKMNIIDVGLFFDEPTITEYCICSWEKLSNAKIFQYKQDDEIPLFQEFIRLYFDFLLQACQSNSNLAKELLIDDRQDNNPFITIIPLISIQHFTEFCISIVLSSLEQKKKSFINYFSSDSPTTQYTYELDIQLCVLIKITDSFFIQSPQYNDPKQNEFLPILVKALISYLNDTSKCLDNYRKLQNGSEFLLEKTILKLLEDLYKTSFFNYQSLCNKIILKINTDEVQYSPNSFYFVFVQRAITDINIFQDDYEILSQIIKILQNETSIKCISKSDAFDSLIFLRTPDEISFIGNLDMWELSFDFIKCISKIQMYCNSPELNKIVYDKLCEIESKSYSDGDEMALAVYLLNISSLLTVKMNLDSFIRYYLDLDMSLIPHMIEIESFVMERQQLIPIVFNHIKTLLKWVSYLKDQEKEKNFSSFQVIHYSISSLSSYFNEFQKAIDSKIDFDSIEEVFDLSIDIFNSITKQMNGLIEYFMYYEVGSQKFKDVFSRLFTIIETVSIPNIIPYIHLTNQLITMITDFYNVYGKISAQDPNSLLLVLDFIVSLQNSPTKDCYSNVLVLISTVAKQIFDDSKSVNEEQIYSQIIASKEDTLQIIIFNLFKYFIEKGTNEGESLFYLCQIRNYVNDLINIVSVQIPPNKEEEFANITEKIQETEMNNSMQWSFSISRLFYFLNSLPNKIHI